MSACTLLVLPGDADLSAGVGSLLEGRLSDLPGTQAVAHTGLWCTVSALKAALWVLAIPTLSTLKRGQCLSSSA